MASFATLFDYQVARPKKGKNYPRTQGVVLKMTRSSMSVWELESGEVTIFRCPLGQVSKVAPLQWVELEVKARRENTKGRFGEGHVLRAWIDIPSLGLEAVPLQQLEVWDISPEIEYYPPEMRGDLQKVVEENRHAYEFDELIWAVYEIEGRYEDLVNRAAELLHPNPLEAEKLLVRAIEIEPRCLDAHAHLGHISFDDCPKKALVHYRIGLEIGEAALGPDFRGLVPADCMHNRGFLRAWNGYALALQKLGYLEDAKAAFEKVLNYNPLDGFGARRSLRDIAAGKSIDEVS